MARFWFGLKLPDWTFTSVDGVGGFDGMVQATGSVEVTFWNAEVAGTQYTDLVDQAGSAVTSVLSADGSNGRALGAIPLVQGPDSVADMWASANGGARMLIEGHTAQKLLEVAAQAEQTAADVRAHLDAPNPHGMGSNDLTDYSDVTPADGQVPVYRTADGRYVPTTVEGLDPAGLVSTSGGSEIVIPPGDVTTKALVVRVPPGDRGSAVNTFEVWWNAGSEAAPNWQVVTRLNPYGELRGRASRADRVYGQVQQATSTQTADLWQFLDAAGNPLSWVDAAGRMRAPNVGITPTWMQDTGVVGVGTYRWYNPTPGPLILRGFVVSAGGTAPAGGDYVINPKLDGAVVYASVNRPRITTGNRTSGVVTNLSTVIWPAGSYLTVDVDSVPSTAPTKVTIQALAY